MKIAIRGSTLDGAEFEEVHEFEFYFELYQILQTAFKQADQFQVWLTRDVNSAEAEPIMAAAVGGAWRQGVCRSGGLTLTRLTGSGGRA